MELIWASLVGYYALPKPDKKVNKLNFRISIIGNWRDTSQFISKILKKDVVTPLLHHLQRNPLFEISVESAAYKTADHNFLLPSSKMLNSHGINFHSFTKTSEKS